MKILILSLLTLVISGCASTEKFNKNFAAQNIATVKNTIYDPIFSVKTKSTRVKKIDGAIVEDKSRYQLSAGKHTLTVSCNYYETASFILFGTHTINVNLIKGHTYKLIPVAAKKKTTGEAICFPQFKDITEKL